jgi:chromosome segregation ATPase
VVAEENKKKVNELTQLNSALQGELQSTKDRLQLETVSRAFALSALQTKVEQLETQYQSRSQEYELLQQRAGQMATQIDSQSKTLAGVLDQNGQLRGNLREAQQNRDLSFDKTIQLTDMLNQSQGNLETLEEFNQQLLASNARMKTVLDRKGLDEFVSVEGPPRVDGVVTQVGNKDMLEISIGADDGLKKGHALEIYRGNSYLGRVRVLDVWPDRAVVQIIPEFRKGMIKKGDRVATKLD